MVYLVPKECWYKKHFPGFQDTILAFCSNKIGKQFQVRSIAVDSTLDCFPVRPKRVGVQIVEVNTEQSNLLPVEHNSCQSEIFNVRNVDENVNIFQSVSKTRMIFSFP